MPIYPPRLPRTTSLLRARVHRAYHPSPLVRIPYKDAQDRQSLKPQSAEQTRSARDDDAASSAPQTAFQEGGNEPGEARRRASEEADGGADPLGVSGANQELSKPQGDEGGKKHGAGKEIRKGGRSRGGDGGKKNKKGHM
ncbi:hypothetical protein E4U43_000587 [Claviceps pusilla]|uniref:Uncharacterized protein n=1 Tax=Claviceps pusilla TaxID=123648 RepID=A0A9P7NBA3_9HYPO|nr:hypothetical protein E4U43_000587 [Claviceps pusilla]